MSTGFPCDRCETRRPTFRINYFRLGLFALFERFVGRSRVLCDEMSRFKTETRERRRHHSSRLVAASHPRRKHVCPTARVNTPQLDVPNRCYYRLLLF